MHVQAIGSQVQSVTKCPRKIFCDKRLTLLNVLYPINVRIPLKIDTVFFFLTVSTPPQSSSPMYILL